MRGPRVPFSIPNGRALRVLIYARYSTEEQNASSIQDQIAYCRKFLESFATSNAEIEELSDPHMSGELVSRPGINKVREGVERRKWDLILVEDASRLFRHETACGELIETAVDQGIRVIAINDDVDTAEENWEVRLHHAKHHHAQSNRYVSNRVKRRFDTLWRTGAAMGQLWPGYSRRPTRPATQHEPEGGPFFDAIDHNWAPTIKEAFERVARKEPLWHVAGWLTNTGLPKCASSSSKVWTDRNVLALTKRTIYRGVETYKYTVVKKIYRTGKHKQVRNDPSRILTRNMPHLRIVPDSLWYAANDAIAERRLREPDSPGHEHPLAGIPRDSRGPLAGVFFCGNCGGKMYMEGRAEGGYRCSRASSGGCWVKATAVRKIVHEQISKAVIDQLLAGVLQVVIDRISYAIRHDQPLQKKKAQLLAEKAEHTAARDRLLDAIEGAKEPPASLVERLRSREDRLARITAEVEDLEIQHLAPSNLPNAEEITGRVREIEAKLLDMDPEAGILLRRFVPRIIAVPYEQFGSQKVVLRARFQVHLARLLPEQLFAFLNGDSNLATQEIQPRELEVDLFDPSTGPKYFRQVLDLQEKGMTLPEIGRELGIGKRRAHIASDYGKRLCEANLAEPFRELTEAPAAASRWRTRSKGG